MTTTPASSSFPKGLDTIYGGGVDIADQVRAMTGGAFDIQVFAAGELVPGLEAANATGAGNHTSCVFVRRRCVRERIDACERLARASGLRADVERRQSRLSERNFRPRVAAV